jgi:hypothetical protein
VTSLAWRSLISLSLPLALGACPGDDAVTTTEDVPSSTSAEPTTTGAMTTTSGPGDSSTTAADSSSDGGMATTELGSSSSGGASESGDSTGSAVIQVCGNNVIEGTEVCDLAQVNGETCQSLGYQGGQLGCLLTCDDYNLLGCFICGNGVVDIAEDCEGGVVPEEITCESMGYQAGDVACGADCLFDTSECSICGDGVQQGPENCDGIDFGGNTCASIGFDAGNLACNLATCTYNVSGCSGGQYLQDFEAGVMPPEFTQGGNANWVVDNGMPIAGTFSSHSGAIGHSQTSSMSLTANFAAAGTVTFWHRESSEACCDFLRFFVDGVQIMQWSGLGGISAQFNHNVGAGQHTLEWRYIKDGSIASGSDRVWVDDIALVPGVPI